MYEAKRKATPIFLPINSTSTVTIAMLPILSTRRSLQKPLSFSSSDQKMFVEMPKWGIILGVVAAFAIVDSVTSSRFDALFQPTWASDHFTYEGEIVKMKLDNYSASLFLEGSVLWEITGAGFSSKSKYMYGKVSVEIKLVEGDSAGTVTAFYMASDGENRNEFDFEFLGNSIGEPYLVQTNVYVNGVGNREQRLSLWFDPTMDFHSYSILWNPRQLLFLIDEMPVRVVPNMEHKGIPYPKVQAMGVYSSIWNADDWATQGGMVKNDWAHAPFVASYKGFQIHGCECRDEVAPADIKWCSSANRWHWWNEPTLWGLTLNQTHLLWWVRENHMVYDYCSDTARFAATPVECFHQWRSQGKAVESLGPTRISKIISTTILV